MEEVPAHVHPGPIVPDVLTKQNEHRSWLIWSGDHETCFTELQCRCFGRKLFQSYSAAPYRLISMRQEVDDMASGVIQTPLSSPSQITSFAKKVQTIIRSTIFSRHFQCSHRVVVPGSPYQIVVLMGLRGVLVHCLVAGHVEAELLSILTWVGEDMQIPYMEERRAPPPLGTVSSSTPHMPISIAFSSDSEEHDDEQTDEVTPAQQLGFGHRVRKKTTRFTPSD
ncbi:hypothetical protein M9H77_22322 [Catharanthus roseus]|uniref:Uncharacterized protein n=1 Tax=Catharanthus roseus TaxID=4058 RepID=A0ACC0AS69_CATRO|nr:hypothetical protein M9H77_22322 [Catharanthus roseus]